MAFNGVEKKALSGLAILYASRMLGLFMVLPILTLYGQGLVGATPALLGVGLGVYGITQAILQIPFGAASDRFGRKPLIIAGLLVFLIGSVVAAYSSHVYGLILGRALQGAGAISGVVLALLADYTRPQERSKAMAVIGAVIGFSFVVAVIMGPWLASLFGLTGVFLFTAALAVLGLMVVLRLPKVPPLQVHTDRKFNRHVLVSVVGNINILVLSIGIFLLHMTITALFAALPVELVSRGLSAESLGNVFAPVMVFSFIFMLPLIMVAERRFMHLPILRLAAVFILVSLGVLYWFDNILSAIVALLLFFIGFNVIEASLPSLLSRKASEAIRGTALGVFSSGQFIGAAAGGVLGGWLFSEQIFDNVLWLGLLAQVIWLIATLWLTPIVRTEPVNG